MIDGMGRRKLAGMVLFALIALAFLLIRLLPLSPGTIRWPGPDLTLCLAFIWILRRPEQIPVLLIAAVFLIEDLLLMRPPGLWSAIVILGSEAARMREPRWREQPFVVEWFRVTFLIALMMFAYRFAMALFFIPRPPFGQAILQLIATAIAYPGVTLAARWLLGLTRLGITESEIMRQR